MTFKFTEDYKRELRRKLFHGLSLVYLAGYYVLGKTLFLKVIGAFILLEGAVEIARLQTPALNMYLMRYFGGIHRSQEAHRVSGVFWTSLGCALTVVFFGERSDWVTAGLLYLALGDAMAALAGKAFGRITFKLGGRTKSVEGSLACFTVCLAAGWAAGLPPLAIVVGASVATIVELLPVPLDDNLWIPLTSVYALSFFS